jgi:N-ethylmaleimide reductase
MGSIQEPRKLFTPLKVGDLTLAHRIVHSPTTRVRANGDVPSDLMVEYYSQRATPRGLLIGEGTMPSLMVYAFEIPQNQCARKKH